MILTVAVIRDIKVGLYQQPIFVPAMGAAVRAFQDACSEDSRQTDISRHPTDFELYEMGTYDQTTGKMKLHDAPIFIIGGSNV